MGTYKDLRVYKVATANAIALYRNSRSIRGSDNLALRSQLVRAAFSIPANIVEGSDAGSPKEFARFLSIAIKSSHELDYHLEVARELGLIPKEKAEQSLANNEDARKMLFGLRDFLAAKGDRK